MTGKKTTTKNVAIGQDWVTGKKTTTKNVAIGQDWVTRKKAFTLAETLITLAIIGIIAALTIPNLLHKYKEKITVYKIKKFYSTMSNATKMAIKEYDSMETWDNSNISEFIVPITHYLKIAKDCGAKDNTGCVPKYTYYLDGSKNLDLPGYDTATHHKFILQDNSTLWMRFCNVVEQGNKRICVIVYYDTNGLKLPNTVGKDIFAFSLADDNFEYKNSCDLVKGWGCVGHIILKGNLNYSEK